MWPRVLAVATMALAGAAGAAPANAHPELLWSDPPAGSAVPVAVDRIVLSFSEVVETKSARIELVDKSGRSMFGAASIEATDGDPTTVTALFSEWIDKGDLTVVWSVVSAVDAHLVTGSFDVRFGSSVPAPSGAALSQGAPATARSVYGMLAGFVRAIGNYGVAVVVGGVTFVILVWPAGLAVAALRRLLWAAIAVATAASAAGFLLHGAELNGGFGFSSIQAAIGSRPAAILAARTIGLPAAAGLLFARLTHTGGRAARSRSFRIAAAATAFALLASVVAVGHGSTGGAFRLLAGIVHLGGVSVWLGGLLVLGIVVLPRKRMAELKTTLPQFSALAGSAFLAAVVGGILMARTFIADWPDMLSSSYGRLLALKAVLVLLIVAAAATSRSFVNTHAKRSARRSRSVRPLSTSVAVEIGLATVVLAVTAILITRPLPPRTAVGARAASQQTGSSGTEAP